MLDKSGNLWYYIQVAARRGQALRKRAPKKLEKSFEKGLTKIRKCAIINKLSERQSGTLKIEQCNQRETLEDSVFTEETR